MPDYPGKISALPLPKLDRRQLSLTVSELSNDNLRQSLDFRIATSGLASRPGSTPGVSRLCIFQENPADAFRFRVGTEILDTLQDLDPPDDARFVPECAAPDIADMWNLKLLLCTAQYTETISDSRLLISRTN